MSTSKHNYENGANQVGNFLAGFLFGGLSGAATMLLLAPRSGKKTRANLKRKGIEMRDQVVKDVEDATAQVRTKAHQIMDDVEEQAEDLQQRGRDTVDDQRDHVGQGLKDLGKAVHT